MMDQFSKIEVAMMTDLAKKTFDMCNSKVKRDKCERFLGYCKCDSYSDEDMCHGKFDREDKGCAWVAGRVSDESVNQSNDHGCAHAWTASTG